MYMIHSPVKYILYTNSLKKNIISIVKKIGEGYDEIVYDFKTKECIIYTMDRAMIYMLPMELNHYAKFYRKIMIDGVNKNISFYSRYNGVELEIIDLNVEVK